MTNVDLLGKTLAYVEAHPDEWHQQSWRCGTSMCFAGHAVALAGIPFADPDSNDDDILGRDLPRWLAARLGLAWNEALGSNEVAAALIGIEPYPERFDGEPGVEHLFAPNNDLDDLRRIVAELCDTAEATP